MPKPDDFIKSIFSKRKHSVFIAVLGKKQSGKTDFMLHLMERLNALKLMDGFGSNMPVKAPFEIDFIEDFKSFVHYRCSYLYRASSS